MLRDADLIRKILLDIEARDNGPVMGRDYAIEGRESGQIMYQLNLLSDAGFITAEHSRSSTNPNRIVATEVVFGLTWKGHEYLDSVRDPEVWRKTKGLAKTAGSSSFEFLLEVAKP